MQYLTPWQSAGTFTWNQNSDVKEIPWLFYNKFHYRATRGQPRSPVWVKWRPWASDQPVAQRPLPDNTQHSQETDIHAPGEIRTRNPTDPRLRWRGYRDLKASRLTFNTPNLAEKASPSNVKLRDLVFLHLCL